MLYVRQMVKTMSHFVGDVIQYSLEQDHMEGVDEHEWVGILFIVF